MRPHSLFIKEDTIIHKKIKRYTAKIALERQHFTEDELMFDNWYTNLTGVYWDNYVLFSTVTIIYFWQKLFLPHNFDFLSNLYSLNYILPFQVSFWFCFYWRLKRNEVNNFPLEIRIILQNKFNYKSRHYSRNDRQFVQVFVAVFETIRDMLSETQKAFRPRSLFIKKICSYIIYEDKTLHS